MNRKPSAERLLSFLFLLITLGVVLYIGFSGNDLEALGEALRTMSPAYLFLCLLSWILYVLTDALAIHHFLRMQGCPIRLWQSLRAAMTGIYYSNVTPGATGGQPMEMYCLHKYGVSIGVSGSGMAVKFIVFQVVLLVTGLLWSERLATPWLFLAYARQQVVHPDGICGQFLFRRNGGADGHQPAGGALGD